MTDNGTSDPTTPAYRKGWERVFGRKCKESLQSVKDLYKVGGDKAACAGVKYFTLAGVGQKNAAKTEDLRF